MIRVVGIDSALGSAGIARADITVDEGRGRVTGSWTTTVGVGAIPKAATVQERVQAIRRAADLIEGCVADPDLIVIEAPAVYSGNAGALDLVGLWYLLLDAVFAQRAGATVDVVKVAPSKLKKYVAGDGRADKTAMVAAVRRHYGAAFDLPTGSAVTDVADAIGLVAVGARYLGVPVDLDVPHRVEAMHGVGVRPDAKPKKSPGARRRPNPGRTSTP